MEVNITLIVVVLLAVYLMCKGYKKGFTKELSGLVALAAAFFVLALMYMMFSSFQAGETINGVYSVIFLVIFALIHGIVRFFLNSAKVLSHLPIVHFLDKVLGIAAGALKALLIVWLFFMFCMEYNAGELTEYVRADIAKSTILKLIYQFNFFMG